MRLICHLTSHDHSIEIVCEFMLLCYYADKSCNHKHCDGGGVMFLTCHWFSTSEAIKKFNVIRPCKTT